MTQEPREAANPQFNEVTLDRDDKGIYLQTVAALNGKGIQYPMFGGEKDAPDDNSKIILLVETGDFPEFDAVVAEAMKYKGTLRSNLAQSALHEEFQREKANTLIKGAIGMAVEVLDRTRIVK